MWTPTRSTRVRRSRNVKEDESHDLVEKALKTCFPFIDVQENLKLVAEQMLASVVYHSKFLRDNLPSSHPLFESVLC